MTFFKRIFLFVAINLLVITMVSVILSIFDIQPYLTQAGLDYSSLFAFCLVWGVVGSFISLALSRVMAKWMMGIQIIDVNTQNPDYRQLLVIAERLSLKANLPTVPQVGVYQSNELNAFATGPSKKRALVAVSSGLLQRMHPSELEAIIGHELSHIANGDMVTMTLIQGIINAFVMFLARALAFALSGMGRNNQRGRGSSHMSYFLLVMLFQSVFMLLGSLVTCAFSRFREYRADLGGAELTGKDQMIAALQTLRVMHEIRDPQKEQTALAAFKISGIRKNGFLSLFATHPSIEDRIQNLQQSRF